MHVFAIPLPKITKKPSNASAVICSAREIKALSSALIHQNGLNALLMLIGPVRGPSALHLTLYLLILVQGLSFFMPAALSFGNLKFNLLLPSVPLRLNILLFLLPFEKS